MNKNKRCYSYDKIQTKFHKISLDSNEKNNELSKISSGTTLECK